MPLKNKAKRVREIQEFLDAFQRKLKNWYNIDIIYKANSAEHITNRYEILLDNIIKEYLIEGTQSELYKVASGMELATIYFQPIIINSFEKRRELTSLLAASIASSFVLECLYDEINLAKLKESQKEEFQQILFDHLTWLKYIETQDFFSLPTFSNALFWKSFAFICKNLP